MSYRTTVPVLVLPDNATSLTAVTPHRDWVKGLNPGHALWVAGQTYPKAQIIPADTLRFTEVTLSECTFGCKIMREQETGYQEIYHSTTYGCPLGREVWSTYESDQNRVHTPGGNCVYCSTPALIHTEYSGWICSYSCV